MTEPVRRSPAARLQARLGSVLEREAGWDLPASFGDETAECASIRDAVAICDITARGKIDVRGEPAPVLEAAGEALVARIEPDWAVVLTEPGGEESLLPRLVSAAGPKTMVTDATHLLSAYALAGPRLGDLLARITAWDPSTLAPGAAAGAPIAGVRSIMVRRDLPVPLLEVYVGSEFGRFVWETLLEVVLGLGGRPVGWSGLRAEGWR